MDCVTHKNSCYQFHIQTYPTIMLYVPKLSLICFVSFLHPSTYLFSIKGEEAQFTYNGDRATEEIVHFALRVAHPPVRKFKNGDLIDRLKKDKIIFFSYLGESKGELWVSYISLNSLNRMYPTKQNIFVTELVRRGFREIPTSFLFLSCSSYRSEEGDRINFFFYNIVPVHSLHFWPYTR